MNVRVRLFAMMAQQAGQREVVITLAGTPKVQEAVDAVRHLHPALPWPRGTMLALNQEYVSGDHALQEGDELAIIPPVSGGLPSHERGGAMPFIHYGKKGRHE